MDGGLAFVYRLLRGMKPQKKLSPAHRKACASAIEKVVESCDVRIRYLTAYKRKLRPLVESTFDYFEDLVAQIPGVIEINKNSFATDPRVHAFFVTVEDLQSTFSRSPELRKFVEDNKSSDDDIFALLCMELKEKTVFGMELRGDIIKRDVQQISVAFSDHQLLAPASTEEEARRGLMQCMFEQLVVTISNGVHSVQVQIQDLKSQRRVLQTRLKALEAQLKRNAVSASQSIPGTLHKLKEKLRTNEKQLSELQSKSTPRYSLDHAHEILSQPENYVKVKRLHMRLNNMSLKLRDDSKETGYEIDLAEMVLGNTPTRVVVLARYPRSEILPKEDFLKQVTPYLSI